MNKQLTAQELLQQLESDPTHQKLKDRALERHRRMLTSLRAAATPLITDLHAARVHVADVAELIEHPDENAIPILLTHLRHQYPSELRETIALALSVPRSKAVWSGLVEQYQQEASPSVKQAIAQALAASADETQLEALIELAADPANGDSRLLLLDALFQMERHVMDRAVEALARDPLLEREIRRRRQSRTSSNSQEAVLRDESLFRGTSETSIAVDSDQARRVVQGLARALHIHGADVTRLVKALDVTPVEETAFVSVRTRLDGPSTIEVSIFVDDVDSYELHVRGDPRPIEVVARVFARCSD